MVFFWLALVALVFGLVGFLAHAFYFDKNVRVGTLEKEIESLTRMLARRDQAETDAEQPAVAARNHVQSLVRQLAERSEQISALQTKVQSQESEIRQFQQRASELRMPIAQIEERHNPAQETDECHQVPVAEINGNIPLWKDNLNHILGMLDKIEKEEDK
jgi:chromosome segregation ATPase